jgi:hypothetical protein
MHDGSIVQEPQKNNAQSIALPIKLSLFRDWRQDAFLPKNKPVLLFSAGKSGLFAANSFSKLPQ